MPPIIDLTGRIFGRITVLSLADRGARIHWNCRCSCGNKLIVRGYNLGSGNTRSCGCLLRDKNARRLLKHGATSGGRQSETYRVWADMKKRCMNPRYHHWKDYGGRGISICERWHDFGNFLADMGEKPVGKSIERVNNALGYEPSNCIWANARTQARNKRNTRFVTICGKRLSVAEACENAGIERVEVWRYRHRQSITLTEAFFDLLQESFT